MEAYVYGFVCAGAAAYALIRNARSVRRREARLFPRRPGLDITQVIAAANAEHRPRLRLN